MRKILKENKKNDKFIEYYVSDNDEKLISPSSIVAMFNGSKYLFIPDRVLEIATQKGLALNQEILELLTKGESQIKEGGKEVIDLIHSQGDKIITLEKSIDNKDFHGYIDIDCEKCFYEIKSRSDFRKVDINMALQIAIYELCSCKQGKLIVWNRKKKEAKIYEIPQSLKKIANEIIKKIVEIKQLFKCDEITEQEINNHVDQQKALRKGE